MTTLKTLVASTALAIGLAGPAAAADLPGTVHTKVWMPLKQINVGDGYVSASGTLVAADPSNQYPLENVANRVEILCLLSTGRCRFVEAQIYSNNYGLSIITLDYDIRSFRDGVLHATSEGLVAQFALYIDTGAKTAQIVRTEHANGKVRSWTWELVDGADAVGRLGSAR